jgi:cytochrome c-type biogenesis protein CcmE
MTRKQKRLSVIGGGLAVLGVAVGLVLYAMSSSIVFFIMPSEVQAKAVSPGQRIRLGGLVEQGSVKRGEGTTITFSVKDATAAVTVRFSGQLPDLFREGQGIVAEGVFDVGGVFAADTVLAKHDENYMPKEVADKLKEQGVWQEGKKP